MAESGRKKIRRKYKKFPNKPVQKFPIHLVLNHEERTDEDPEQPRNKMALDQPSEDAGMQKFKSASTPSTKNAAGNVDNFNSEIFALEDIPVPQRETPLKLSGKNALELSYGDVINPAVNHFEILKVEDIPLPPGEPPLKLSGKNALELSFTGASPENFNFEMFAVEEITVPQRQTPLKLSGKNAQELSYIEALNYAQNNLEMFEFEDIPVPQRETALKLSDMNAVEQASENVSTLLSEEPSALLPPPQFTSHLNIPKVLSRALRLEDQKYSDINFNEPPAFWSMEDKMKMWDVVCTLTIQFKIRLNIDIVYKLKRHARCEGLREVAMYTSIMRKLNEEIVRLRRIELKELPSDSFKCILKTYDWDEVAEQLNTSHTPAQCKEYWYMDLCPKIKKMTFCSKTRKMLLKLAVENKYCNWDQIAEKIPGYTEYQIYVYFRRNIYNNLEKLAELVRKKKVEALRAPFLV